MVTLSRASYDRIVDKVAGPSIIDRPFSARREDLCVGDHIRLAASVNKKIYMFTSSFSWECTSLPTFTASNAAFKCAAAGKKPVDMSVSMIFPLAYEKTVMRKYVADIFTCAEFKGIGLVDAQVFKDTVDKPVVNVTVRGEMLECPREYHDTEYKLISVGNPGDAGTIFLRDTLIDKLSEAYPKHFLTDDRLIALNERPVPQLAEHIHYGLAYGEGGIFAGLERLSDMLHLGFEVVIGDIRLNQLTVEISEELDISPYELMTASGMLLVTDAPEAAVAVCTESGLPAQVIGVLNKTNDKIIRNGDEIRFLDTFKKDSITEVNYES